MEGIQISVFRPTTVQKNSSLLHIVIMRMDHQELEDAEEVPGSSESTRWIIVDTFPSSVDGPLGNECASLFAHLEVTSLLSS